MDFKKTKTIIFDWDGTIHQSMAIYYEAFLKAYHYLETQGYAPKRKFTEYDVSQFLGMNPKEMWLSLLPELTDHIFHQASMIISNSMKSSIAQGHARLYPKAIEVLTYLKEKGYMLVYLSNSKIYYMEAMKEAFQLERFFDQFHVSEMYDYIPKHEILTKFIKTLDAPMVMIGDRSSDMETGTYNNVYTIGCLYGYGHEKELEKANLKIQNISDLLQLF
jgi:phosphoglycolate phosphatase